jgi:N-acetylmuramoyl-L-alanine amidase
MSTRVIGSLRILLLVIFFCICPHRAAAQSAAHAERLTLSLSFDAHTQREIAATLHSGVRYAAVNDLAAFLSARTFANQVLKKVEIILPSTRFKFTAGSPFVIITTVADGSQTVYQLTAPALYADENFSIPITEFLGLYERETHQKITAASDTETKPAAAQSAVQKSPDSDASAQLSVGSAEKSVKYSVTGIDVEAKRNGYLLRIHASERLPDAERMLQGGQWLYLTIPKGKGNVSALGGMFQTGIVKRVIPVQSAQGLQLSFQLREKVESAEIIQNSDDTDILVALRMAAKEKADTSTQADQSEPAPSVTKTVQSEPVEPPESKVASKAPSKSESIAERQMSRWKLDVVVLDAGHGGHDPGTIGSMGTHEADVTLGIALKLGALIQKNLPGVKVVYTRRTDTFVELYRRGQIANEAGGKLFISIHCNSTPKKMTAANGFEIYLLRPGKTEAAIDIAEQENSVVRLEKGYENRYQKLTDENFIILTMAQSAYVKQSERFAEILETEMAKKMVYQSRGVKQAGFYVLVGASMPNILVETGYLSNRKDETLLRGLAGQYLAAQSIFDGLKKFKAEYERNFMAD